MAPSSSSSQCRKCLQLLQESLLDTNSKHYQLLQKLTGQSTLSYRLSTNDTSIELELAQPSAASTVQPFETTTTTNEEHTSLASLPVLQRQNTMATSSSSSTRTTTTTTKPETLRISCRPCDNYGPEQHARAFVLGPYPLSIVLCSNRLLETRDELSEMLTHELLHVYDVRHLRLDLTKCPNLAYSEIRACREAECQDYPKSSVCIRQKAVSATSNLFDPQQARACVDRVWKEALHDHRPFRRRTVNGTTTSVKSGKASSSSSRSSSSGTSAPPPSSKTTTTTTSSDR